MVLFFFLCLFQLNYGQKFDISNDSFKYNSLSFSKQSTMTDVNNVFGAPDKSNALPGGATWTYNNAGIKIGFNPSTNLISYVEACYKICEFVQCPTSVFSGTILLYGKTLTKTAPINSFKSISDIKFDGTNNEYITVASIPGARICWSKSGKAGVIDSFSINF